MKMPATLGACVDAAYKLRAKRLELQKEVDAVKSEEEEIKNYIINTFTKTDIEGVKGKVATAGIIRKTVAQVGDWEKFQKYIIKEEKAGRPAFDLMQRRVNDAAYRARLENGVVIPGVEPYNVTTLSLTKISKG